MALNDLLRPRVCELGKIKIGGLGEARKSAKGGTYRLPVKHDYFEITGLARDKKGDLAVDQPLMKELIDEYGDDDGKLRQLPITLLADEPEDIMQSSWVWYAGKKVCGRSDGNRVTFFSDPFKWETPAKPLDMEWKPEYADLEKNGVKLFKLYTVFNCVLACKESRWGGVYKFRTSSRITGEQIYGSLLHIAQLTGGVLRGLPMRLVVRPMQVAPEGKVTTVHVVHCELRGADLIQIQNQAMEMAKLRHTQNKQLAEYRRLLQSPGTEPEDEAEKIAEEFANEHQQEEREPVAMPKAIDETAPEANEDAEVPEEANAPA